MIAAYAVKYAMLTAQLKEESPELYEELVLMLELERVRMGFLVRKINKATSKGTKIHYKAAENAEQLITAFRNIKYRVEELRSERHSKKRPQSHDKMA